MANAFNTVDRGEVLRVVHSTCPELFPYVEWLYASESRLLFQGHVINSSQGVQQGDPLGPALFSLVIRRAVAIADTGTDANLWYLDDGTIGGDPDVIAPLLAGPLRAELHRVGLSVKLPKCEIVSFGGPLENDPFPPEITRLVDDFDIVGTPIGCDSFVVNYVRLKAIKKLGEVLRAMGDIEDPQVRYCILRQCLAFGPLVQLARTVPPRQLLAAAREFDALLRRNLATIIGGGLSDRAWLQANLSVKAGGLGIRAVADHLHPAFLGCASSCAVLDDWNFHADPDVIAPLDEFSAIYALVVPARSAVKQRDLSALVDARSFGQLLANAPDRLERARLRTVSGENAGAAFNCLPSTTLRLALPPAHFRVIVKWYLGLDVYPAKHSCPRCGAVCDTKGYHALTCRHGGDLGVRHNALRNIVLMAAHKAAMGPRAEQRILPGSNARPADLLLPVDESLVACDFAVTHPHQPAYVNLLADPANPVNAAAEEYARTQKTAKYAPAVEAEGYIFRPVVCDAWGNWTAGALQTFHAVALHSSFRDGQRPAVHRRCLLQRLSVALFVSNARALLVRSDHALAPEMSLPDNDDAFDEDAPLPSAFINNNSADGSDEVAGLL